VTAELPPALATAEDRAAYLQAHRYLRVAGLSRVFFGLTFTACGVLGGILVLSVTDSMAGGAALAAAGVVAGLLSSRRGLKVMRTQPLRVEGRVRLKRTEGRLHRVVMEVRRAAVLNAAGEQTPTPDREGDRSLTATPAVFATLREGEPAALLCLPTGLAVGRLDGVKTA